MSRGRWPKNKCVANTTESLVLAPCQTGDTKKAARGRCHGVFEALQVSKDTFLKAKMVSFFSASSCSQLPLLLCSFSLWWYSFTLSLLLHFISNRKMSRNQDEIRAGLLRKLGIFPHETAYCVRGSVPPTCSQRRSSPTKGRRVSFKASVSVVEIPSHRDYDETIRESLWSNGQEIHENACRNKIEFRAEGWDWRNAVMEDSMFQMPNGELLHPATYALLWELFYLEYGYQYSTVADTCCHSSSTKKSLAIRNVGLRPPLVPVEAAFEAIAVATCAYGEC